MTNIQRPDFQNIFRYDYEHGRLIRVRTGNPVYIRYKLKKRGARPYGEIEHNGKRYAVHRVVWAVVMGTWPTSAIDHINRDTTDNKIENLRLATPSDNAHNKSKARNNTSGYSGIDRNAGKWRVRVGHGDKSVFGGRYDSLELAIKMRDALYEALGFTGDHGQ
jgi:hypothetical protein